MDFGSLLQKWQVTGDDDGAGEKKTSTTKSNGASHIGRFVVPKSTKDLRERFQSPEISSSKDRANGGLSRNDDFKLNLKYKSTTDLREKFQNTTEVPKARNTEYKRTYKINGNNHGLEDVRSRDAPQRKVKKDHSEIEADTEARSRRDETFGSRRIPKTHSNGDPPQLSRSWRNVAQKEENKSDPFDTKHKLRSVGDLDDRNTEPKHVFRKKFVGSYAGKSETDDKQISTPSKRDTQQVNKVNGNVESSSEEESEESLHKIDVNPAESSRQKTMELNGDRLGQKTTFPKSISRFTSNVDASESDRPTNRSANFRAKWQSKFKDLYGDSDGDAFNVFSPKVKPSTGGNAFSTKIEDDMCKWSTDKGNEDPLNVIPSKGKQSETKETFSETIGDDTREWSTSKGDDGGVDSVILLPKAKQLPAEDVSSAKLKDDDMWSMGNGNAQKTTNLGNKKINGFGIDTDVEKDDFINIKDKMKQRRQFWISDDKKKDDVTTTPSKESNGCELQGKFESRRNRGNVLESRWKEPERNTLVTKQRTVPKITGLNSAAEKWKERERENLEQSDVGVKNENRSHKSSHNHEKYHADKARYKNTQSASMRPKADNNFVEKSSEDGSTYDSESGSDFGTSGRSSEIRTVGSKEIPINKVEYFETVGGNIETKNSKSRFAESSTAVYEGKPSGVSINYIEKQALETSKRPTGNEIT